MRENNRKPIEKCRKKLPQFTTMNVIDGQAGLVIYSSLILYSLTIDNILNIIVLLILAGVSIATLTGQNGILTQANTAKVQTEIADAKEQAKLDIVAWQSDKMEKGEDSTLSDSIIKGILTGKDYVKEAKDTSFITAKGDHEIPYSDLYTKTESEGDSNIKEYHGNVPIPNGFYYVGGEENTGLVISDVENDDMENSKKGNQFVWVPVADIDDMAQCETAGGNCNLELQDDGTLKCTTHNSTNIVGKLYATTVGENFGTVNTSYNANSGLREPAIVTGNADGTGTDYDGQYYASADSLYNSANDMLEDLKDQYKKMATSVAKNGGFYIGRYELSKSTNNTAQSKVNSIALTADNVNATQEMNGNMWYGLYKTAKTYTVEEDSVVSSMVWGSQYDAMINWMGEEAKTSTVPNGGIKNKNETTTGPEGDTDVIKNVYDLFGGRYEWTLEAYDTNYRVLRRRLLQLQ